MNQELERTEELMVIAIKRRKKKRIKVIIIASVVIAVVAGVCAGIRIHNNNQVKEQLKVAETKLKESKYNEAIAAYDKVIELDVDNAAAYEGKGDAYMGMDQSEKAVVNYNTALDKSEQKGDYKKELYKKSIGAAKQAGDTEDLKKISSSFEKEYPKEARQRILDEYASCFQDLIEKCETQKDESCEYKYKIIDDESGTLPKYIIFDYQQGDQKSLLHEFYDNEVDSKDGNGMLFAYSGGRIIRYGFLCDDHLIHENTSTLMYSDKEKRIFRVVYRMDDNELNTKTEFPFSIVVEEIMIENSAFVKKELFRKDCFLRKNDNINKIVESAMKEEGIVANEWGEQKEEISVEKEQMVKYFNEHNINIR